MASSLQGKANPDLRRVTADEAVVLPEGAHPTDESPTVISKTSPLLQPVSSCLQKITDLARKPTTPDSLVASLRGKRLAHYELIEPIGVGGMAAVIRARDTQLDRFVALKILPPEMADEPENVERFHQEARAAAKLDHENVARVFYCGEDQGLFFIAFEFVEGINLRTMLEQRGRIPVAEAVRYILQVATGLEHAATRGVVHRDVKPSNIIVTPTGRAKLVDMGLARNLERGERDLTQSGVTLGTFDYISPEQALEPREADARSDIYSLGCTFYHLLTGMPAVPEGTPAKKLDHHQHHAPIDPRQFDPKIPDAIVMILGKMMAKNPKDRYQRPIHLVQHLMQVAQDIGAVNELPEGVMFVDAPLPGQMQKRPALAIGLALAALVAITLFLSLFADPTPPLGRTNGYNAENKAGQPDPHPGPDPFKKDPTPKVRPTVAADRSDLERVFDDPSAKEIKAKIVDNINLETGLVFKGGKDQRLELETADNLFNGTLFHFTKSNAPTGLLVEGGAEVVFRRVRFQVDSDKVWPNDGVVAAAVTVRGVKTVRFEQCVFVQPKVPPLLPQRGPIASLFIDTPENTDHPKPVVILNDCLFDSAPQTGGQVAIAINGAATVNLTNCAFMPHAALVQFRKDCTKANTNVHLHHCGGFVVHGPAFRFAPKASAQIYARNSVFSRPDGTVSSSPVLAALPEFVPPVPSLIFLPDPAAPIEYVGESNLYHNLNLFVERRFNKDGLTEKNEPLINNLSKFQEFLAKTRGKDSNSNEISASPWTRTSELGIADEAAFQLKAEFHDHFGLRRSWLGREMPAARPVNIVQPAPKSREKIVDADDKGKTPGVRASLAEALAGAEDKDVILIKHGDKNEIIVRPIALKPGITVTIRPFKGCEPILVLDKDYQDKDSFLFKVQDSKLQIENMEIMLDPVSALFQMQSIVHLGETGHCVFKNCYLTLRGSNDVPLNVVTLVDLEGMVKMGIPSLSSAHVEFHECFVRGRGDLVALNGCRLLHVDMKNSLVALKGSLLDVRAANKVMPMSQGVRWKMERSSVFTTESIFALKSPTGKGLTETHADIDGCLLASLAPKQPIVDLEVEEPLAKYLKWKGEQNYFANFAKDSVEDWRRQSWETKSDYGRLTFADLKDEMIQKLWDATPDWFKLIEGDVERLSEFGVPAAIEKRMMPPSSKPEDP